MAGVGAAPTKAAIALAGHARSRRRLWRRSGYGCGAGCLRLRKIVGGGETLGRLFQPPGVCDPLRRPRFATVRRHLSPAGTGELRRSGAAMGHNALTLAGHGARDAGEHEQQGRDPGRLRGHGPGVRSPAGQARGGPRPLLDTLTAYYASGCLNTATARRLGMSVRTIAYRLRRIRQLTGHDPTDPDQRSILQTAALGARLLDWPWQPPLQPAD